MAFDDLVGKTLGGRYELLELIGRGGMGAVFKARQTPIDHVVAVKVIDTSQLEPQSIARFKQEANALSRLNHPNIVKVLSFAADQEVIYLVMELVEGRSLEQVLTDSGKLSIEDFQRIFGQVAEALAHAHDRGIIHRDVKPSNIMLAAGGTKLVDFGVAKLLSSDQKMTKTGAIIGTPHYISPEQCSGSKVDERSDVYSLGCVMYRALTGRVPFERESAWEVLCCQLSEPLPAIEEPSVQMLAGVIAKATEKDPSKRYQSMQELVAAIEEGELYQPTVGGRRRAGGSSFVRIAAVSLLVAACVGGASLIFEAQHPHEAAIIRQAKLWVQNPDYTPTPKQLSPLREYVFNFGKADDYALAALVYSRAQMVDIAKECMARAIAGHTHEYEWLLQSADTFADRGFPNKSNQLLSLMKDEYGTCQIRLRQAENYLNPEIRDYAGAQDALHYCLEHHFDLDAGIQQRANELARLLIEERQGK